jgi:hypothetical protein
MVFGTAEDVSELESTPAKEAILSHIMGAWTALARNSRMRLTKYGWPRYSVDGKLCLIT